MIKLGIIGTNFVSDWLCDSVTRVPGVECAAVYSRKAETGAAFAQKHGIPKVETDLETFLSLPQVDAVYVASPNAFHYPQTMAAIAHGKHVLCEKPIALDSGELSDMIRAAKEQGVVLLEAMRPAFDPALAAFASAFLEIGPLRHARFEFCQYSSRYDRFKNGEILNAFQPALGNAALMDIGVYAVHVCVKLFGLPLGADGQSDAPTGFPPSFFAQAVKLSNGFEGLGRIFLPYPGFSAEILYSKITESVQPSIVTGENGSVTIDKLSMPSHVILTRRGKEPEELSFEKRKCNMEYEVEEFARLIRCGGENPHLRHSVAALRVMDWARAMTGTSFC